MPEKIKNVLITAGGTVVKIDDVRHIGNFSGGRFAARLAEEALAQGYRVLYLCAKKSKRPFADDFIFDPSRPAGAQFQKLKRGQKRFLAVSPNLRQYQFETVEEYAALLKNILHKNSIDMAFLAAAVSDYGITPAKGKISSDKKSLKISLFRYPKIIKSVKQWSRKPLFQIGFKLLSGATEKELCDAAYRSLLSNKSNLVLANDLKTIRRGRRKALLVTPEKNCVKMNEPELAKKVFSFAVRRTAVTHFRTLTRKDPRFPKKYAEEIALFRKLGRRMWQKGLLEPFSSDSGKSHGSLALRMKDSSFLITARETDKKNLKPENVILVKKIDWKKRLILSESPTGAKPSFNAVLVAKILSRFPAANAVVHAHRFAPGAPTTPFPETPGTLEYARAPLKLLTRKRIINLKNHGLLAMGNDLEETLNYAIENSQT